MLPELGLHMVMLVPSQQPHSVPRSGPVPVVIPVSVPWEYLEEEAYGCALPVVVKAVLCSKDHDVRIDRRATVPMEPPIE